MFSVINMIYVVGFGIMSAPALMAVGERKAGAHFPLLGTSSVDETGLSFDLSV